MKTTNREAVSLVDEVGPAALIVSYCIFKQCL